MQDPTKWDIVEARTLEFGNNVKELWVGANSDQKAFLVAMSVFVFFFFLVSALWVRWRIVNRVEIRKVKHYAAMRSVLLTQEDRAG